MRLLTTVILLFISGSALSQTTSPAVEDLMEQCVVALEACESKTKELNAKLRDLTKYRQVCDSELKGKGREMAELEKAMQFCRGQVKLRQQRIENLTEIEKTLSQDREQCYTRLEKTMENYQTCVQETVKPWWHEALFYLGIILGLAIGIPIG